ncbi:NADH-quinone oxidoreductase subunit L [Buchnera aphidicola (Muscaphis stroyani)]|uniref:NADH-quinone oxidoreductase subunit L n=1 Tax=Buchnera aphidicola (Muscaphis stroyani) TaxID=1241869 RepID=A0A4D6Y4A8_9GAMM|nr:NADH-quinone oxidoreductase subunit L [Buchnera aphidicola]QCI24262.1 NADH-quinone oxidoreductase subunit L [Buchnera aphidicola (Muscaphis stroyani)]
MNIIFLLVLSPLISFLFLSFKNNIISKKNTSIVGCVSIFISLIITIFYCFQSICNPNQISIQKLWNLVSIDNINISVGFIIDDLSLIMLSLITGVGFFIHIFSIWYMRHKDGYSRFFACTNLFIASMLVLVLSDNFLLMYVGWEGISICSYLLINFYYDEIKNNNCAFKAFVLTRISDIFLMISFFLIYQKYGTFNFQEIHAFTNIVNIKNFYDLNLLTLLLFIGVIGKSAQFPLQSWLSDAMVGPTPISALIHAATMVIAGVYLIERTYFLFLLTPDVLYLISVIGTLTILISSLSALVQSDVKRILAYSTMSQIGYMFLALGVEAWIPAIMHLITHAIFKALLFLSAGSLISSCHGEKNIFKMGGLRKKLPFLYVNFLVGGGSLISFPLITSGFYSKGSILFSVFKSGHINLFLIGLFCSFLTVIYTLRMIFLIFHGKRNIQDPITFKALTHHLPMCIFLFFSTAIGFFLLPSLSSIFPVSKFLMNGKLAFEIMSSLLTILGVFISYHLWVQKPYWSKKIINLKLIKKISFFWMKGWGFDYFYNLFFVNFYLKCSKLLYHDPLNLVVDYNKKITQLINYYLLKLINGYVRWYAASMVLGINLIFVLILFFY